MLTFRIRTFLAIVAFAIFTLAYISVGMRWHVHRARAGIYARQEMEHTFEAANFARAARAASLSAEGRSLAVEYRKLAQQHERAARECTRLRELYEGSW